jgi:glycosyltransferase involved in cell wall biosynthesis
MKIVHTITSIDSKGGGTSTYLQLLANKLCEKAKMVVCALDSDQKLPLAPVVETIFVQGTFPYLQAYSRFFVKALSKISCDLFHGNGMWQFPVHAMVRVAKKRGLPYVISPHGMLEPWALNKGRIKKRLILALFQHKDISQAQCIHATAAAEAQNLRTLGFKNPIAVIPNGIALNEYPLRIPRNSPQRTLLFLSRIHPKKGIELLIEAWAQLAQDKTADWKVEIAGNGEAVYIQELQQFIESKQLSQQIKIIGSQFGSDKLETYHRADLFVLPTYSENFGIVVTEALSCGVPVITTKGTPWEELETQNCGWWVDTGVEPLKQALEQALVLPQETLQAMGKNGRKLVEEKYSIEAVAEQMLALYKWILNKGEKPEFVFD